MMIQEEQILKEKVGQRNCFKVPEGYFDQLSASVMESLPQQEQKARTTVLRKLLYTAASVVIAVLMGVTYYFHQDNGRVETAAAAPESNYYEELADYAMIDNMDIYVCMAEE